MRTSAEIRVGGLFFVQYPVELTEPDTQIHRDPQDNWLEAIIWACGKGRWEGISCDALSRRMVPILTTALVVELGPGMWDSAIAERNEKFGKFQEPDGEEYFTCLITLPEVEEPYLGIVASGQLWTEHPFKEHPPEFVELLKAQKISK